MALFRDCYSKSQTQSAYKFILMASPDDGWMLHIRASQELCTETELAYLEEHF